MKHSDYKEIEDRINPNTFITLTLKQGIQNGEGSFIAGSPQAYDRVVTGLFNEVLRRIYGKRAWRRKRKALLNLTTLELSRGGQWHIHSCLRRPSHVNIYEFRAIISDCWRKSRWYMPHFEVDEYRGGGVSYILKDGQDSILIGPTCF